MKEMICRLCLQTIIGYNNCQPVEESLLKSLKLNPKISKENVMCIECANCLQVLSNYTEDNGTKIKCRFCTKTRGREDLISLRVSKENKSLLEQYIPRTNLKNTEELVKCETCLGPREGALSVILKRLEVEEKIRKYVELEGTDDKGQVELKKVQQFTFGPIIESEIKSFGLGKLENGSNQGQKEYTTMAKSEIKHENEISNTEVTIKTEEDDITSEQSNCDIPDVKSEQSDYGGFQGLLIENKSSSKIKMFQCEMCPYESKHRANLRRHSITHKSPSEMKMFKCELCSYEAKRRRYVTTHLLTHKNRSEIKMFKCGMCSFETKYKRNVQQHFLTHKSPSEINMFKCELCSYEAKHKNSLARHLLTHQNPSKVKMFKCEFCSHETKRKDSLLNHLMTHKNRSKIKMFNCEFCSHQTMRKDNLRKHLLTHKTP